MKDKTYLIVSGVIFALWTGGQLSRLAYQVPVQVGTWQIPMWPTLVGAAIALVLCIWAFWLARPGRQQ